jgi:16S rRNA processing protein RimM
MPDRNGARPEMVALGTIVNTHGIRGELKVRPYNPDTEALGPGVAVVLRRGEARRPSEVRSARRHKNCVLVVLDGVDTMNAAEALVGYEVEIPAGDLPDPGEGEAYHFQLIGLTAVTTAGEEIGIVEEIFSTAASDICVVRRGGREFLIPYVDEIVREVDLAGRRLVVEPIPGLLEP